MKKKKEVKKKAEIVKTVQPVNKHKSEKTRKQPEPGKHAGK